MTETSHKRLIIDLEKCDQCESCSVKCGYYDRPHANERRMSGLRLKATFAVICRRCTSASCIDACVFDALDRDQAGTLQHHNLRCVSCKMCAHACPFGTIYTDMLPFYEVNCDACLEQNGTGLLCVDSCPQGALEFRMTVPSEKDIHIVDHHLAARGRRWVRQETVS